MPAGAPPTGELADRLKAEAEFWGIDWEQLEPGQRATFAAQERALKAYQQTRRIGISADAAGIHERTIMRWRDGDNQALAFRERLSRADDRYVMHLEELAAERIRNPQERGRLGGDALLIAMLRAHAPDRYKPREERTVNVTASVAQRSEVVHSLSDADLQALVAATKPGPVIDAEARVLPLVAARREKTLDSHQRRGERQDP